MPCRVLCVGRLAGHKGALLAAHLVHPELGGALLGGAALVALGNEPVGAGHQLGGAGGHVVPEQALLCAVLPLREEH